MSPDSKSFNADALRKQLYELRREGFAGVFLPKVSDLLKIAERLAPDVADPRQQIEVSIELAISDLEDEQEIARLWFGLHEKTRGKDKNERTEAAAAARYVSVNGFQSHIQSELIKGIREALMERYLPLTQPAPAKDLLTTTAPRSAPTHTRPLTWRHFFSAIRLPRRYLQWILSILIIAATVAFAIPVLVQPWGTNRLDPFKEVPPPGTVIDAATGSPVDHILTRKSPYTAARLELDDIFRGCDLSTHRPCIYPFALVDVYAHSGDIIQFRIRLSNPSEAPLPYVRLAVERFSNPSGALALLHVQWPEQHRFTSLEQPGSAKDLVIAKLRHFNGFVDYTYIPGSTVLRDGQNRFMVHLPDGIFENGIELVNIGPPVSCFRCNNEYRRYIYFKARVNGAST